MNLFKARLSSRTRIQQTPCWVAIRLLLTLTTVGVAFNAATASAHEASWQTLANLEFPTDTRVAFEELRKTRLQRTEKAQTGILWIAVNGDLSMEIAGARPELRQIQGTELSLTRGDKVRRTALNANKGAHQLLLVIVDVLRGDILHLQDNFRVAESTLIDGANTAPGFWQITLEPLADTLQKQLSAMVLSGENRKLQILRTERGSSYQQIQLSTQDARPTSSTLSNAEQTSEPEVQLK